MLILVRHGRTAANAHGLLQGRLDLPLDEVGAAQAEAVARYIGTPDRVVSSPLRRATQTSAAFGCPVHVDVRWIELDYGEYDGLPLTDVGPATWARWRTDEHFALPGGESLATVSARVGEACAELLDAARDQTIVVVSHVSPIKAAVAWALDVPVTVAWRCHLDAAAICRIECRERGPVLVSLNEHAR